MEAFKITLSTEPALEQCIYGTAILYEFDVAILAFSVKDIAGKITIGVKLDCVRICKRVARWCCMPSTSVIFSIHDHYLPAFWQLIFLFREARICECTDRWGKRRRSI